MRKNNNEDSSSSQNFHYGGTLQIHFCRCGNELPLKTSGTKSNPGRRYWACPNYGTGQYCGVFKWLDNEMCPRSKQIIPGLLAKINKLEAEVNDFQMKEKKLESEVRMLEEKMNTKYTLKTIVIIVTICVTLICCNMK
ncbi:hypothetical protein CASFOL_030821 [Castilleja foliolosa]|uniref:GRF-type domain-containing protein n=1 Tax=Castilleja foliolosa TaxID=1961234 RepID=A0ABD3C9F2_9LAMI